MSSTLDSPGESSVSLGRPVSLGGPGVGFELFCAGFVVPILEVRAQQSASRREDIKEVNVKFIGIPNLHWGTEDPTP